MDKGQQIAALRHALLVAAQWFEEYGRHHRSKAETDPAADDKANRNEVRALYLRQVLANTEPEIKGIIDA